MYRFLKHQNFTWHSSTFTNNNNNNNNVKFYNSCNSFHTQKKDIHVENKANLDLKDSKRVIKKPKSIL